jgi:hypothetical protein
MVTPYSHPRRPNKKNTSPSAPNKAVNLLDSKDLITIE